MIFNDSTALYFYSAVFQGNMALGAIISVFVIFKLQEILNEIQKKESIIINYVQNYFRNIIVNGNFSAPLPLAFTNLDGLFYLLHEIENSKHYAKGIRERAKQILDNENLKEIKKE